jgi:hypothetical protein
MDVDAILSELNDHGFTDQSTTRKLALLNDTYWDICSREPWPFLEEEITLAFDGTDSTPTNWPTDFRAVLAITDPSSGAVIRPERLDTIDKNHASELAESGEPFAYYFLSNEIRFIYIPSATTTLKMRYLKRPAALVDGGAETTILLPKQHHRALILGTLQKLYDMLDDPELGSRFEAQYETRIVRMRDEIWMRQYDRPDYIHMTDWDYSDS